MIGDRREDPMSRVEGTDLFWYETTLEPDARVSYHFVRDFEERFPDPRNPWRVPAPASGTIGAFPEEQSSLAMPAWRPPDHLVEAAPERRGTIEEHVVEALPPGLPRGGAGVRSRRRREGSAASPSPSSSTVTTRARRASCRAASTT